MERLQTLCNELTAVRSFAYLNGFYHMSLKDIVNNCKESNLIDAYVLSAGSLRVVLSVRICEHKGEEYYLYRISSTGDYTKCASDGGLETRDFQVIKEFYSEIINKHFIRTVDENEV